MRATAVRRRWSTAVGAAGLAAVVVSAAWAGIHLEQVHQQYWQWRWTPTPDPPKIPFEGRDYGRGLPVAAPAPGSVAIGRTAAGQSTVYGPALRQHTPTGLQVHTCQGRWVSYDLMGGP